MISRLKEIFFVGVYDRSNEPFDAVWGEGGRFSAHEIDCRHVPLMFNIMVIIQDMLIFPVRPLSYPRESQRTHGFVSDGT
ncbi:hypothetical protein HPL003_03630 [Paenibacillus terrae HPL-003]|uniref:Uncharacterized protein n=1 Tax=Paenibacillus terrae (strain HPL-003) TaxID=985665 RepID=G7VT85_PAETH|nr:hypothetical protein HPL003_03630 [Paenibacillus terrae HPL-003]